MAAINKACVQQILCNHFSFSFTKLYQANDDQVSPLGAFAQPILEPCGLLQVEDPGVQRMQCLPATSDAVQLTMLCNCAEQAEYLCIDQPQTGMLAVTKQVMLAFMSHWFPCQYRSDEQHQHCVQNAGVDPGSNRT